MPSIVMIAHDIRSTHNVGSLLRTAEGLGIAHVYFTGYTPYPLMPVDNRLPHISAKLEAQIQKTALDAQKLVPWSHEPDITDLLGQLKAKGFTIAALEQGKTSIHLPDFQPPEKLALLLGREVEGIAPELLRECDITLEIPMLGRKESFNVVQAAAMALFHCRFAATNSPTTNGQLDN